MSYTISLFHDLRNQHPTWDAMKAFLTGADGGSLICKERQGSKYAVVFAKKGLSSMDKAHSKWFRSVVWNTETNMPVSVMTQKAEAGSDEILQAAALPLGFLRISEYLEGVTLTVFREAGSDEVQVSSRSQFGAGGKFYKQATKSFAAMLTDALGGAAPDTLLGAPVEGVGQYASVLLQHPEHRVVTDIRVPLVYVLQSGEIAENGTIRVCEQPGAAGQAKPETYFGPADGVTVADWFAELAAGKPWGWQGVMLHDMAGRRWRIRSTVYRMIRSMRGNTPRSDERFFGLRAVGLVKTYLIYYPEEKKVFWQYEQWIRQATAHLFQLYTDIHKTHVLSSESVDGAWLTHIGALHTLYLTTLRPEGRTVKMAEVVAYMNALPVPRLLYLMNLGHRRAAASAKNSSA
jgi:hypothetical protein